MKQEYKDRVISNLESINKRVNDIKNMIDGTVPPNDRIVYQHILEIQKMIENSEILVDAS